MAVWTLLTRGQLKELEGALASGQDGQLLKHWGARGNEAAVELASLRASGMVDSHIRYLLGALAEQAQATQAEQEDLEVVWTGPEGPTAQTRDTLVTARQLLEAAEQHVLLASYVFYDAEALLEPLAKRMVERPALAVTVVANAFRKGDHGDVSPETALDNLRRGFLKQWPGPRLPTLYYDPRALNDVHTRAVMHAKCILVDDRAALVTSANLTGAAHNRNIEVGLLTRQREVVSRLRGQFMALAESGQLALVQLTEAPREK